MFQGLRQNAPFYILEKEGGVRLRMGQVMSVSNPVPRYIQYNSVQPFAPADNVVDIKVKIDDEVIEFKQLSASQSIENSGKVVVSDNKEAMMSEVESMMIDSKSVLDKIPYYQSVVESCNSIMRELNPQLAKEKEQGEKIDGLEKKIVGIESALNNIQSLLSESLLQKSKRSKEE